MPLLRVQNLPIIKVRRRGVSIAFALKAPVAVLSWSKTPRLSRAKKCTQGKIAGTYRGIKKKTRRTWWFETITEIIREKGNGIARYRVLVNVHSNCIACRVQNVSSRGGFNGRCYLSGISSPKNQNGPPAVGVILASQQRPLSCIP